MECNTVRYVRNSLTLFQFTQMHTLLLSLSVLKYKEATTHVPAIVLN